ncbi:hypothetical protein Tco_1081420 [Tanacetum coccineum]|uniref:Reverse transcriptase domain-containing protein n=1 Tax=Tanacetum coccineum TaxID=301880 RepID=A0ABQ5HXH7_9ASTR
MKATPRKLAYADSDKEALAGSLAKGFSDRFSLESFGISDTRRQTRSTVKSQKTPSKNKEPTHLRRSRRLEVRSTTMEKAIRERSKSRRKRFGHQETSSDSEYEEGSDDACEDLNSPYKRPKPTPFTKDLKFPRNIRVYEGNKDPEDHLGIFSAAAKQEEDSFEELSHKFLEEFSQQKRYAKDPTVIHGIKRRQNEGLQAFMDRFKSESSHIKGVPPVMHIYAFMHGHGHPELVKKLNDKIPKTVDEMFERIGGPERARNRGGPREARRNMGVYTPYPRKDTFTPPSKTLIEILSIESISFPEPSPLIETPEKQNLNKFCDYHGDRGHNTNDCYQLKKEIKEAVASRKLAHLVKDIRQNNQRNGNPGRNGVKVINMIRQEGNRKRSFEEGRGNISSLRSNRSSSNFGKGRKNQYGANGFCNKKCRSPYKILIGRTGMRSLGAVGSAIHSMIKFSTNQGVVTMETSREALQECKYLEREQGLWKENAKEAFTISHEHPDQYVTMETTLTTNCKKLLADVLWENREATYGIRRKTGIERKSVPLAKGRTN